MILTMTLNASIDRRFVTCGARQGEVNRVKECRYTAGGKGLNVSRVLALSRAEVLTGGIVGGYAGKYIEAELDKEGIPHDFYQVTQESRSCINIWDEETRQQTEYLEPGFTVDGRTQSSFLEKFREQIQTAGVLTISGSVPQGFDENIYQTMITIARQYHKKVILDSGGTLLLAGLSAKPTLIKPNIDEIRMLTGRSCEHMDELIAAADDLMQTGIEYVVISLGGKGALMVTGEGRYQAVIPKIKTVNTVGCGDAMVAGLAMGLNEGASAEKLLLGAASIATAAAMSEGTGFYEAENQKRCYNEIIIKRI